MVEVLAAIGAMVIKVGEDFSPLCGGEIIDCHITTTMQVTRPVYFCAIWITFIPTTSSIASLSLTRLAIEALPLRKNILVCGVVRTASLIAFRFVGFPIVPFPFTDSWKIRLAIQALSLCALCLMSGAAKSLAVHKT
jgi:hypothetical protein